MQKELIEKNALLKLSFEFSQSVETGSKNHPNPFFVQLMPSGELVTVPVPFLTLCFVTVSFWGPTKVAITDLALSMVTVQVSVPKQAPLQPVKVEFTAGVAERETGVLG